MNLLAELVTNRRYAWTIIAVVAVVTALSFGLAGQLKQEDDVLDFLPADNADIATFQSINKEFGGLDAALVGIETDDVFDGAFLEKLQATTDALSALPNLDHVLSITNVADFQADPMGGVVAGMLVPSIPASPAEAAALRASVLSRDHIRGSLVSDDGTAVVLVAFAAFRADQQEVAGTIRTVVEEQFKDETIYWGGAPFISTYIFQTTQEDLRRLSPWAVAAILLIMVFSFRDLVGTLLGLVSTGIGILISRACMVLFDVPLNIVLGSMPIILFAVGSAYGIHILSRFNAHAQVADCPEAVRRTIAGTGPVVLTAGLTTAVGLLSFVAMDIEPLRIFGMFTAVGIVATLALSLTFIPAVLVVLDLQGMTNARPFAIDRLMAGTRRLWVHKRGVGVVLLAVTVVGVTLSGRVNSRVDQSAFYSDGSLPDRADAFLTKHFGGSQFIQVVVDADLRDPVQVRRIRELAERIEGLDHVARVQHVGQPLALLNRMMEGAERIPDSRAKLESLMGFLTGNPAVRQLANEARTRALMHVTIGTAKAAEIDALLTEVEALVADDWFTRFKVVDASPAQAGQIRDDMAIRVERVLHRARFDANRDRVVAALEVPAQPPDAAPIRAALMAHLQSAEALVPLEPIDAEAVAEAVVALGPQPPVPDVDAAVAGALGLDVSDPVVGDIAWSLGAPADEGWAAALASAAVRGLAGELDVALNDALSRELSAILLDRNVETVGVVDGKDPAVMTYTVSGLPVMHRGLSQSVTANQFRSLAFAMGLVAIILSVSFRSVRAGLLATAPMALALLVIYGVMGAAGISLDIGTSMLASLIIGAGVDYAVHVLSAWYAREGEPLSQAALRATARVGPAVWTNAVMVAVGFFVLTLGDARPLKNVGGLTAAAMLVAAATTFLVIPLLAGRRHYTAHPEESDPADIYLQ
ncbi:MAG: MMPL family transporter [Myxococcota bacterium]|nr:MMPL family transporter [Myxococcota bacterium]MEC9391673.1 MMPL family transporter [Myxococcota bacterium]